MGEFLFGAGQLLCIAGLLYGAYFSITFRSDEEPRRGARSGAKEIRSGLQKLTSAQNPTAWDRMASHSAMSDL